MLKILFCRSFGKSLWGYKMHTFSSLRDSNECWFKFENSRMLTLSTSNLGIQIIHVTLSNKHFYAPRWTTTTFGNKYSVIGRHVRYNLVNHFNLPSQNWNAMVRQTITNLTYMLVRKIYTKHTSSGQWQRSATSSSVNGSTGSLQLKQKRLFGSRLLGNSAR